MATSGQISGLMTARDIVRSALTRLGVIGAGEDPSANDMDNGIEHLNWMLKEWQADGWNLWRTFDDSIVVPAGTATVTLDPRVMDVLSASRLQAVDYEMPLERWEIGDYDVLPNKAASGQPIVFVPRKNRDNYQLTFWRVPNVDTTINYTAVRVIEDVTDEDENIDCPQEWTSCVIFNLADRMAGDFGPEFIRPDINRRAAQLYQQMRAADRPSYYTMGTYDYGSNY